jgi:hypothetical protein
MLKSIQRFLLKYRPFFFWFLMIATGLFAPVIVGTTTYEDSHSAGNRDDEGRKTLYYCEIEPATGALKTDRGFGKLPFALEESFLYDPKEEPYYNCEKTVEGTIKGNLDSRVMIKCKTNSSAFEDFITKTSVGKEYALLFSTGRDALVTSVGSPAVEYFQEQMRLAPRGTFIRKVDIKMPDGKLPDCVFQIMRPVAAFTLDCGDGASPTEGLNAVMPQAIATEWGLDATALVTKVFSVNPQEREYDIKLCQKTF